MSGAAEPGWLTLARTFLGVREIPGPRHSNVIGEWLRRLRAWWQDDETPWCGTFVAVVLQQSGQPIAKHWYRARDWLNWEQDAGRAVLGAVVVLKRGPAMGHVGFVVGWDAAGQLLVLGGNQGNAVTIAAFSPDRVLGYRWPAAVPLPAEVAPVFAQVGAPSTGEA